MSGRPGWPRRTFQVQNNRNPARCQARTVSGVTMASAERQSRQRRDRQIHVKREYELEEPVALVVEKYATFIDSTPNHVVNSALKMLLWKDKHFMNWRKQQQQAARKDVPITATQKSQARA
jgi:hypothetical protein